MITRSSGRETEILPNHESTVYLFDANHQQKAELSVKTNEYGSYSGSFELPQGELNGIWFIRDDYGTKELSVEEYKRPKFEVTFAELQGNYRLNDSVQVKGSAQALAGYGIDGAEVHYTIKRAPRYPAWRYSRHTAFVFLPRGSEQIIQQGDLKTDANGEFSLEFEALPDPAVMADENAYFSFTVSVDVTDLTGETRSANTSVYAGYKSLVVDINLPERLKQNDDTRYLIKTTNLAGTETAAKGEFKLTKLDDYQHLMRTRSWDVPDQPVLTKDQFVELFPHDIYDDEKQPAQLARKSVVSSFTFDTAEETAVVFSKLGELETGYYLVEMSATDPYGETVSFEKYLLIYQVANGAMPVNEYNWFEAVNDTVQPGETARLLIGTAADNVRVLYEIEHDEAIVQRETLLLNNEQRLIEIPVEEKHRGNFQVHFSYIKDNRAYTKTHTIKVPFDNKKLTLEFTTFRDKLLPGQQEQWQIAVSGPNREKIAAELLAGMYDASLDVFRANPWHLSLHRDALQAYHWYLRNLAEINSGRVVSQKSYVQTHPASRVYESLNLFGFSLIEHRRLMLGSRKRGAVMRQALAPAPSAVPTVAAVAADLPAPAPEMLAEAEEQSAEYDVSNTADGAGNAVTGGEDVQIRSNFAETAFFYPQLQTDEEGRFIFTFTVPESLTRWKFQSLAHTQDLQTAILNETVITQKT